MNTMVMIGRVNELPIMIETSSGVRLARLVLEVERNFRSSNGEFERDCYQVTLWRGIAETVSALCEIGDLLAIKGRLQASNYISKEEQPVYAVELIAEKVSFLNTPERNT